ncbi:OLC1v1027885C1 [Oldenlandia corymbosa var. corymbosa]|uniref:OLC1v1027885C1 n=1 Tax=Oldenlandia corymbosa var. corymbosa TaxID=529605 RepID=A0AAV1CB82_OLDCO|nr:OLC1v1027885C1 [Oldenlandia corymbosa var. corymbosa]
MTWSYNPILSANQDIWYEILLRVSPKYIFRYMLVSKEWLELITSHSFRKDYTRRWEIEGSTMVGFMICKPGYTDIPRKWLPLPPSVQLLATSEIGRAINRSKLMKRVGYFLAATPNGRFILSAVHPRKYYVSDLTFSSVTGEWEQSVLTCPTRFGLQSGFVVKVIEDVVYWRLQIVDGGYSHIAPHHTNGRRRMVNFIQLPQVGEGCSGAEYDEDTPTIICLFAESFDASPQGFLRYVAGTSTCFKVWVLLNHNSTETNSSTIDPWKLCYRVVLDSIWINNLDEDQTVFS